MRRSRSAARRKPAADAFSAAALYAQALGLVQVGLEGIEMERVLLLAMRSRAELSTPAAALVDMIESAAPFSAARHSPRPGE